MTHPDDDRFLRALVAYEEAFDDLIVALAPLGERQLREALNALGPARRHLYEALIDRITFIVNARTHLRRRGSDEPDDPTGHDHGRVG